MTILSMRRIRRFVATKDSSDIATIGRNSLGGGDNIRPLLLLNESDIAMSMGSNLTAGTAGPMSKVLNLTRVGTTAMSRLANTTFDVFTGQNTSTTPALPGHVTTPDWLTTTTENTTEVERMPNPNEIRDFYIGLFLAISSTLFIGTSFIVKKKGLLKFARKTSLRAGAGGYGYLKEWLWWLGMIMMSSGEIANFAAYTFAPATLVTPLGALSVIVTAVLSSKLLNERLNLLGKMGCLICLLGSTVVVINAPKEQEIQSMHELAAKLIQPGFIVYAAYIVVQSLVLIFIIGPRYGQTSPFVYILTSGSIGSLSVMGCKGLGVCLKQTFAGHEQFSYWLTWVLLAQVFGCITVQMNYLNKALDIFNTSVVTPILYVFFTAFTIIASAILFKEWGNLNASSIIGIISGFLIIVCGIFLLQAFKDMNISFSNLPQAAKRNNENGSKMNGACHDTEASLIDSEDQSGDEDLVPNHSFVPVENE